MSIFYEAAVTALAVTGVISLAWWAAGWLLRPRGRGEIYLISRPRTAGDLECAAHQTQWLRQWGADVRLCVVTDELDDEGAREAGILSRRGRAHAVCRMEELVWHDGRESGGADSFGYLWQ